MNFFTSFLVQENLDYFRAELKNSSQALSDILGEAPVSSSVGLTPTLMDDELPVLPSAKQGSIPVASQPLTTSGPQSQASTTKSTLPTPTQSHPPPITSIPAQGHSYFSYPTPIMSTGFSADHDPPVGGGMFPPSSSPGAVARKRLRRPSAERAPGYVCVYVREREHSSVLYMHTRPGYLVLEYSQESKRIENIPMGRFGML